MLEIGHIIHRINSVNTYNAYTLLSISSVKEGDDPYIEYHFKCNNPLSDFTWWNLRSDDPYIISIVRDEVLDKILKC